MISKKHIGLGILAIIALSGCRTFEGQMHTKEKLTFNERKNNVVEPGVADAKLKVESKDKVILEVSKAGRNNNPKITFRIPKHEPLPSYDGAFELTSQQVGQPYDVKGDLRSKITRGPQRRKTESCTYYDRVERCQQVNGREYCEWERVERTGERCVEYYEETTIQDLVFDLYKPGTSENVSQFDGQYRSTQDIITWRDHRCDDWARGCW